MPSNVVGSQPLTAPSPWVPLLPGSMGQPLSGQPLSAPTPVGGAALRAHSPALAPVSGLTSALATGGRASPAYATTSAQHATPTPGTPTPAAPGSATSAVVGMSEIQGGGSPSQQDPAIPAPFLLSQAAAFQAALASATQSWDQALQWGVPGGQGGRQGGGSQPSGPADGGSGAGSGAGGGGWLSPIPTPSVGRGRGGRGRR